MIPMHMAITESKTALGHALAKQATEALTFAYPGHFWKIRVDAGVMFIQCATLGRVGMVRHLKNMDHDAEYLKRDVIRSAGELLERASIRRGANNGDDATKLDGGEKFKWRPRIALT